MPDLTWSPALRLLVAGVATGGLVLGGAPTAAAGVNGGETVCHSSVEKGVEVDTCTGKPNAGDDGGSPGVRVVPEFCFGIGFASCDD
jgi:hypothetical protein